MPRNLLLVEFPWGRDKDPRVPLGHASILAMLGTIPSMRCKSLVKPINAPDFQLGDIKKEILGELSILDKNSDIAIGVYVWCEDIVKSILSSLRSNYFEGRIILGGPQISYSGSGLERIYPEADIFVRGYGEFALAELMTTPSKITHRGVHYAGDMDMEHQTVVDLDLCPSPWLEQVIHLENQPFVRWETQRGCQFSCGFCQHKEAGARLPKHRFHFNRVGKEIDLFCKNNVEDIAVLDPIFNSGKQAVKILKRFHENGFKGRLSLQCRAEMITDEFIEYSSKLNVRLEFGLQTIHENEGVAVNRKNNMNKVRQNLTKIIDAGIEYEVSVIYGLPEQTLDSFRETINWCLSMKTPVIKAFPLMLLRGTDTEKRKDTWGFVESGDSMPVAIQSDTFSFEDWLQMSKISQSLKGSENMHPSSIELLEKMLAKEKIQFHRFQPLVKGIETST